MLFLDASALTKAYVSEFGDGNVQGLMRRAGGDLFLSDFVVLEVLTSLRNANRGAPRDAYLETLARFWRDYEYFNVVEVSEDVVSDALALTTRHRDAKARSMDLLHLATALRLQAAPRSGEVTMVTSDLDLAALAKNCGLRTFDPSREPLAALPVRGR